MGIDQYRVSRDAFTMFYDKFLQNNFAQRKYRITLTEGDILIGVPTAGSIIDPQDPNASFAFRSEDDQHYRIPFRVLADAEEVM